MSADDITSFWYFYIFIAIVVSISVADVLEKRLKARTPATRPYRWGFYVGCMGITSAPLALLMVWAMVAAGMNDRWDAFGECLALTVLFTIDAISGWFVIQRKRWAWVVRTIFSCNIIVWIINYIYGRNRWSEFIGEPYAGTEEEGYEMLADATKLEAQGRVQEAIVAYQRVADRYSHNAAGNDAKISIENLAAFGHNISKKQTLSEVVTLGAQTFYGLLISENIMPSREIWEHEFLKRQNSQIAIANSVMDELWKDSEAAGREFDRVGGKKRMQDIVMEILQKHEAKGCDPQQTFGDYNTQFLHSEMSPISCDNEPKNLNKGKTMKLSKLSNKVRWLLALLAIVLVFFCTGIFFGGVLQWNDKLVFVMIGLFVFSTGIIVAPLQGKRFITVVASLFIFSCLFPPWRYDHDDPAGYAFLFNQPHRVQIDFGRLFLEWAALAAVTGIIWMIVIKPARSHDEKANQSPPPTNNPKN